MIDQPQERPECPEGLGLRIGVGLSLGVCIRARARAGAGARVHTSEATMRSRSRCPGMLDPVTCKEDRDHLVRDGVTGTFRTRGSPGHDPILRTPAMHPFQA